MLSKKNRLSKEKDFKAVFANGKTIKNDLLVVRLLENNLSESRIGFIVSKKVSSKANVRNKVKRRLRGIILNTKEIITKPMDIIFIALPGIDHRGFIQIKESVHKILKKIS